jgi:2-polyprenyl-3-methyl-5-hydroxy-6-metoxy-1,4-benzoquinol methylase
MPLLARALVTAGRLRRRRQQPGGARPRDDLVSRYAPRRSFLDVGCMWNVHGRIAFLAEEAGAARVTGIDVTAPTPEFEAEHARRASAVRFVRGDLNEPSTIAEAGRHDVVWCYGVLYHVPDPVLTLRRLRELTGETLLLSTETLPEVPGLPGACVLYPALDGRGRRDYAAARSGERVGITTPYTAHDVYANWWWGITPSALRGMLEVAGLELLELSGGPFHRTAICRPAHVAK